MARKRTFREWPGELAPLRLRVISHLDRLEYWSFFSLLGGLALPILVQQRAALIFGLVSAAWATVNISIAIIAKFGPPPRSLVHFARVLALNQVLNIIYVMAGMLTASGTNSIDWRYGGYAVALQGFALMVLDGKLIGDVRDLLSRPDAP